jgi:hypothetical protein
MNTVLTPFADIESHMHRTAAGERGVTSAAHNIHRAGAGTDRDGLFFSQLIMEIVMHRHRLALVLLAAVLLPLSLHAQETPQPERVAISGQVRLRSELDDRHVTADESVLLHLLRSRLRATAHPASWLTVLAEIQDSRFLGSGQASQGRGTTDVTADGLDMHQAYGEIDHPFDMPLSLRVGRQEISVANERLVGVSNWSNTARAFDGARLMYKGDSLNVDAFAARLSAPVAGPTASQNLYGLWGNWRPVAGLTADIYGLIDNNTAIVRRGEDSGAAMLQRYTFGAYLHGGSGIIEGELEGFGQLGNNAPSDSVQRQTVRAFMASATLSATILPDSKTKLYLLGTVLSGDGAAKDTINETFSTVFGTNHKPYGPIDIVPDLSGSFGLVDLSVGISSVPTKGLRLLLEGHTFMPQRGGGGEKFGNEFDLTATWRGAAPFELSAGASAFNVGKLLETRLGTGTRSWAYLSGTWDF